MTDINCKANKLVSQLVDNLHKDCMWCQECARNMYTNTAKNGLQTLAKKCQLEAREIYRRSNMNIPDWCRDE